MGSILRIWVVMSLGRKTTISKISKEPAQEKTSRAK